MVSLLLPGFENFPVIRITDRFDDGSVPRDLWE